MSNAIWKVTAPDFSANVKIAPGGAIIGVSRPLAHWQGSNWSELFRHCRNEKWEFRYLGDETNSVRHLSPPPDAPSAA